MRWDVTDVWDDIEPDVCQISMESIPRRSKAVIKTKGGNTKHWIEHF
jgi:hypothetical protein